LFAFLSGYCIVCAVWLPLCSILIPSSQTGNKYGNYEAFVVPSAATRKHNFTRFPPHALPLNVNCGAHYTKDSFQKNEDDEDADDDDDGDGSKTVFNAWLSRKSFPLEVIV
jgi:hypothetical protein